MKEPKRLSYSSLSSYAECGERWRLTKGYGLDKSTWFATVAGSAVHEITELNDLKRIGLHDGPIPSFKEEFDRLLNIEAEREVLVKASGRKLKSMGKGGGPNKKDYEWWLIYGPPMIDRWEQWVLDNGYTIAIMPDGSPGVEVVIDVDFAGEKQLGFIDRVYVQDQSYEIAIIDLKTGAVPKSKIQLGCYRLGLLKKYGIDARLGAYWMGSDGELTELVDLTMYSPDYIENLFDMAWKGIRAGVFLPNVGMMCGGCPVKDSCRAVGGAVSITIPMIETVEARDEEVSVSA